MSRVIPAADVGAVATWGPPTVEVQGGARRHSGGGPVTAGVLADLQAEAYAEAFQQGLREGTAAGREQVRAQVERLDQLLTDLARPFTEVDEVVQRELLSLAMALARQIVRRELRQDPTQIIGIVREAIASCRSLCATCACSCTTGRRDRSRAPCAGRERAGLDLVEDPMMMRGGCQVLSSSSRIDVRLEQRLGALLSELMGSERDQDTRPSERP